MRLAGGILLGVFLSDGARRIALALDARAWMVAAACLALGLGLEVTWRRQLPFYATKGGGEGTGTSYGSAPVWLLPMGVLAVALLVVGGFYLLTVVFSLGATLAVG